MKKNLLLFTLFLIIGKTYAQCWETLYPYPTSNSFYGLTIEDSNRFYASGYGGTIFEFTYGGNKSKQFFPSTSSYLTTILSFDSLHIVAAGSMPRGFIGTDDGGSTWYNINMGNVSGIRTIYRIGTNRAIAVGENGDYLLTNDRGKTWETRKIEGASHLYAVDFIDTLNGYIVGYNNILAATKDGGLSWAVDTLKTKTGSGGLLLDIHFTTPQTGFAVGYNGVLLRTQDGAKTWTQLDMGITDFNSYLRSICVFENGELVIIGDNGKYYYSIDNGNTWRSRTVATNNFSTIRSKGKFGIIVCANGDLLKTQDNGQTWSLLSRNLGSDFNDTKFFNGHEGIIVGSKNKIFRVTNAGDKFTRVESSTTDTTVNWRSISRGNSGNLILVGGDKGKMIRSFDKGKTWIPSPDITNSLGALSRIWFTTPQKAVAINTAGQVLQTNDGGFEWKLNQSYPGFTLRGLYFKDSLNGVMCGDSVGNFDDYVGKIWKTADGGNTWTLAAMGQGMMSDIDFVGADTGYIVGGIGLGEAYYSLIIKTTDGGDTWKHLALNPLLPNFLYRIKMVGQKGIAVGHQGECYRTFNAGATWSKVHTYAGSRLVGLDFPSVDTGYVVGYNSTFIRYRCESLANDVQTNNTPIVKTYNQNNLHVFPNPSKGDFYITEWEKPAIHTINVYDLLGRKVTHDVSPEGDFYKLTIKAPAGIYILKTPKQQTKLVIE